MRIPSYAKTAAVVLCSTILATLAVNAVDMKGAMPSTLLGLALQEHEEGSGGCPKNMVLIEQALEPFCVDRYEVSAGDSCPHTTPSSKQESATNLSSTTCEPVSEKGRHPWTYLSQTQAQLACAKVGKRLPSAGEWYKAALGTPDDLKSGESTCNIQPTNSSAEAAGEFDGCRSSGGAYDMVGNVWEWVEETVQMGEWNGHTMPESGRIDSADLFGMPLSTSDKGDVEYMGDEYWGDNTQVMGVMRGGYYGSKDAGGTFSVYAASPPSFSGGTVGFRCVTTI